MEKQRIICTAVAFAYFDKGATDERLIKKYAPIFLKIVIFSSHIRIFIKELIKIIANCKLVK